MKIGNICPTHPELEGLRHSDGNCKACACERAKRYRATNVEKRKEYQAKYRAKNKEAVDRYNSEWRQQNKDIVRKNNLKRLGFTIELYDTRLAAQDNKCAICSTPFDTIPTKQVHADHCHTTGKARGILCHQCNTGLGAFKDNPNLLEKAIQYLGNYDGESKDGN